MKLTTLHRPRAGPGGGRGRSAAPARPGSTAGRGSPPPRRAAGSGPRRRRRWTGTAGRRGRRWKRSTRSLRLSARARRRGTARGPSSRRSSRRTTSSCIRSHWLKTTTLAAGSSSISSSSVTSSSALTPWSVSLVEQVGAVARHPHVLQGDQQPPLVGLGQEAGPAPALHDPGDDLAVLLVVLALLRRSSARRSASPAARAAPSAPCPWAGGSGSAPASGRCGRESR